MTHQPVYEPVLAAAGRQTDTPGAGARKRSPNRHLLSLAVRFGAGTYFAVVAYAFWLSFLETGKLTSLAYMVSEGFAVLLFVLRRETDEVSRRPVDWLLGSTAVLLPLFFRPAAAGILPDGAGVVLMLLGVAVDSAGKISLGRSFGVVAANRGVVSRGVYRLVRHPIYLGYVIGYLGFILANSSAANVALYILSVSFIVARTRVEERYLLQDKAYVEYAERVRYRLVPLLY